MGFPNYVRAIASNFDKLPENVSSILFKLVEDKDIPEGIASGIAKAITENFYKLPENIRNDLLFKLADNNKAAKVIASFVSSNFNTLPENVRNELLLKSIVNGEVVLFCKIHVVT